MSKKVVAEIASVVEEGVKPKKPRKKKVIEEVEKKTFETIWDILLDTKFIELLSVQLNEVKIEHSTAAKKAHDEKKQLRRDSYQRLFELGFWTVDPMVKEYVRITKKLSSLPSVLRNDIQRIILFCAQSTLNFYNNETK